MTLNTCASTSTKYVSNAGFAHHQVVPSLSSATVVESLNSSMFTPASATSSNPSWTSEETVCVMFEEDTCSCLKNSQNLDRQSRLKRRDGAPQCCYRIRTRECKKMHAASSDGNGTSPYSNVLGPSCNGHGGPATPAALLSPARSNSPESFSSLLVEPSTPTSRSSSRFSFAYPLPTLPLSYL